ncbi:hypothetical protein ACFPOI_00315 [Nonomuraea angiospora]|uniref:Acylesterase/phospholipase RssA n=1 Tax=Nonomuraea angiospora TaxID=46172 RepID=A0ABR9M1T3_9ACTN|nr:putative acylesterase/phospholipase RssA [Nonomuraea angiospora]
MARAVVLGGGGVLGIAWETGVLAGLAANGVDLREADLVVGTVCAGTAGPGVRPPATIGGRRYIDGGMRSPAGVSLAAAARRPPNWAGRSRTPRRWPVWHDGF